MVGMCSAFAIKLANPALKVVLLEARRVGGGTTGFSTCKLSAQHSLKYSTLIRENGRELATTYASANVAAIETAAQWIRTYKLDCDFARRASVLYTTEESQVSKLREEAEAAHTAGIAGVELIEATAGGAAAALPDLPGAPVRAALRFADQAQFNAYAFANELARVFVDMGGIVHEATLVNDVSLTRGAPPSSGAASAAETGSATSVHTVSTAGGARLYASHVVVATHMPIMDSSLHFAMCTPSRSYCLAVTLEAGSHVPQQMYMSVDEPQRSLRSAAVGGGEGDVLVISGQQHHVGDADPAACYAELEEWSRKHYRVARIVARWSAMDYYPADNRPYMCWT